MKLNETAKNKAKNCAQKDRRQVFDEDVHKNAKQKRPIKKIEESSEEEISESIKSHDSLTSDEDPQQFFERLRQEAEIEETVDEDEQPIKEEEFVLTQDYECCEKVGNKDNFDDAQCFVRLLHFAVYEISGSNTFDINCCRL
ncbi:hypothetical protein FQA39_LY17367 [Lamprigera yunnana]|nr:hypothetical protein FQA39_LY17367 [Lamprigera yunnana]